MKSAAFLLVLPVSCVIGIGLSPRAQAASPGREQDVERGSRLAHQICSACHVVAADQQFPPLLKQRVPSFAEIASRPETTEASLTHFITSTHWDMHTFPMSMPSPQLSKSDTRAVARYILSLRR